MSSQKDTILPSQLPPPGRPVLSQIRLGESLSKGGVLSLSKGVSRRPDQSNVSIRFITRSAGRQLASGIVR